MSAEPTTPIPVEFTLNGASVNHIARGERNVLDVLREDLGIKSIKPGCSPQGICGCCAALVDGKVRLMCTLPYKNLAGKEVTTLEGFADEDRAILAESFNQCGGTQCGYCTPGIALQVGALLEKNPDPTDADIDKALNMHICRCTGWTKIRDSVHMAAKMKSGEIPVESPVCNGIGDSLARNRGHALVLGEAPYIDDMIQPGMLHGALVWTPHPKCRVLRIDATKALALEGVHAVVKAEDFGPDRKVGLIYRDWPVMIAVGEETRCVADILAAVAADTRELALRARDLIEVEVEELEPLTDLALAATDPDNVLTTCNVVKGDAAAALADQCDVVITESFWVQPIDQAFLEPEASLAIPDADGGLHIYSCGQGVFDDQKQLCPLFGLPPEKLVVELVPTGGGFGAKEDLNVQPQAAMLALKTGQPVKVALSMEESTRFHPKRHAMLIDFTLGAKSDGTLVAVKSDILGDTGGYASVGDKVLERAAGHACGPYHVPNVQVEAKTIYTNNPVAGAMRGFGVNQIAFALEGCLDRLAEKLGMDPFDLRYLNALDVGDTFSTGQVMDASVGIRATLLAIKPHYEAARAAGKHVGVACGMKNVGMGNGFEEEGRVELHVRPGHICIKTGFTEMGQGHDTVMRQFAAESTGLSVETFTVECDTSVMVDGGMTTASRATYLGGNAILAAVPSLISELEQAGGDLSALEGQVYKGIWKAPVTHKPGSYDNDFMPVTHYAFGYATQLAIIGETGLLEEVVAAHDVGRAINPISCEGQIEGAVHMGIGYALSEELLMEGGVPDLRFRALGILKAKHTPRITSILVEEPDLAGPYGAKGIGEIGLVPTAPAIAAAITSHSGTWHNRLPMRDTDAARGVGVRPPRRDRNA